MPGVILGAVVVWGAQYYLPTGYAQLVNGGGILLFLLFLPEGIGGLLNLGRDQLLRVVARRRGTTAAGIWRRPDEDAAPAEHRPGNPAARLLVRRPPTCSPSASMRAPMADRPPPTGARRPRASPDPSPRPWCVMGLGAILPMSALTFVLLLPQMQDAYHQGLSILALLAVQQLQTGLGPDLVLALVANQTSRTRVLVVAGGFFTAAAAVLWLAGVISNQILLYMAVIGVVLGSGSLPPPRTPCYATTTPSAFDHG